MCFGDENTTAIIYFSMTEGIGPRELEMLEVA